MARPKKLKELNKTHGNARPEITTMDQLLGVKSVTKYGTLDASEYEARINKMSHYDLTNHALEMGINAFANDNLKLIKDNLMKLFYEHVAGTKTKSSNRVETLNNANSAPDPKRTEALNKMKKILQENT